MGSKTGAYPGCLQTGGYTVEKSPTHHRANINNKQLSAQGQFKLTNSPVPQVHIFGLWEDAGENPLTDTGRHWEIIQNAESPSPPGDSHLEPLYYEATLSSFFSPVQLTQSSTLQSSQFSVYLQQFPHHSCKCMIDT